MLNYLQPSLSFNQDLVDIYTDLLNTYASDPERLERILETLSIFHTKDEELVQLIVNIYPIINDYQDSAPERYQRLRYQCYSALTTMGVKSGSPGMPFQVDLDLKQLLESAICNINDLMPVRQFLKEVLKSVESDIDRGRDRENLTW
jgi:hypothetical protein